MQSMLFSLNALESRYSVCQRRLLEATLVDEAVDPSPCPTLLSRCLPALLSTQSLLVRYLPSQASSKSTFDFYVRLSAIE